MLTACLAGAIGLLVAAALHRPLIPWNESMGVIVVCGVAAFVLPFVILAHYKGQAGTSGVQTVGIIRDFAWLRSHRPPSWILDRATTKRPGSELPHVTVIGLAAMNWASLFDAQNTASTWALLRKNPRLRLGIALARYDDPAVGFVAGAVGTAIPAAAVKSTLDVLLSRLQANFLDEFRDRIEIRLLPSAVPDSMCAYDPGGPHSPCVVKNISRGWQEEPYPVLVVEDIGEQRDLYAALHERVERWWAQSAVVWPPSAGGARDA